MKRTVFDQLDLFAWADNRPSADIIDLIPIIVRTMPDVDPQYPEPAKVFRPIFPLKRSVA